MQLNKYMMSGKYWVYVEDEKCIDLQYFGSEKNEGIGRFCTITGALY
jgi:hypothetical protein